MKHLILITCILGWFASSAQDLPPEYFGHIRKADSLYEAKAYKSSAFMYNEAFKLLNGRALHDDRYNAACSWALAGYTDSAFKHLLVVVEKGGYSNYQHISTDSDLNSLHGDKRWTYVLQTVKNNKEKVDAKLNRPLVARLDSVYAEDQAYRVQLEEIEKKYGWNSKEVKAQWKIISQKDSINLIKIKAILDRYGWLGPEVVGSQGNTTLFLVIQHSDLATQDKYLPMMRQAVKDGKARASSLALLEDRVAIGKGKRQIYGSQIGSDQETQTYYVMALDDPDHVDERRREAGLGPLAEYVSHWKIKWDVEQYKKDLPAIEKKQKAR